MTLSRAFQDDLCSKLRMVGLPKEVVLPIVDLISRQVRSEGPESVVKRLKVLKQAAVNYLAGQSIDLPWISHTPSGPKGPWKPVWRMLTHTSHKHKKRAFNAMMVYASLVLPKDTGPTPTQERKFLLSVEHPDAEVTSRGKVIDDLCKLYRARDPRGVFLSDAFGYLSKLVGDIQHDPEYPDIWQYLYQRLGTEASGVRRAEKHLGSFLGEQQFHIFHSFPEIKKVLGVIGEDYFSDTHPWNGSYRNPLEQQVQLDGPIGSIGFTQEPGCKLRAFAAPNLVVQAALDPMKQTLLKVLSRVPWDCTHDQDSGVRKVQQWIQEGKTCYSVDLSDATNNFPLKLQMWMLRRLAKFPETTLLLFDLASRSQYRCSWGRKDSPRLVAWNVGQPLGLAPSFMSFALAHALIALASAREAGIAFSEAKDQFLILGDDFITCNGSLHEKYRGWLKLLGCPVSESKCLTSNLAGEFAGKLVTSSTVFHGYKYREVSNQSFLAVIKTLGQGALSRKLLTPRQYAYARLVAPLPEPVGLGFNPKGLPFAERWEAMLHVQERLSLSVLPEHDMSVSEMGEKLRHAFSHPYWTHVVPGAEREFRAPNVMHFDHRGTMELIRQQKLKPARSPGGDPRPDPVSLLDNWERKLIDARDYAEKRMAKAPRQAETKVNLAPTPSTGGETSFGPN